MYFPRDMDIGLDTNSIPNQISIVTMLNFLLHNYSPYSNVFNCLQNILKATDFPSPESNSGTCIAFGGNGF